MQSIPGMLLMHLGPLVYAVMQVQALRRWRGLWGMAAILPMGVMGAAGAAMYVGLSRGSDTAPMLLALAAAVCMLWLAVFGSLYRIFRD